MIHITTCREVQNVTAKHKNINEDCMYLNSMIDQFLFEKNTNKTVYPILHYIIPYISVALNPKLCIIIT